MKIRMRLIQASDNNAIQQLAKIILQEVSCIGAGLTSEDQELFNMYEAYQKSGSQYWVVVEENTDKILGSGGFSMLKGTTQSDAICELQKIYFYPEIRGKGLGKEFVKLLITEALKLGYKEIYLETLPTMVRAINLYYKLGFKMLLEPKGKTGHYGNNIIYMGLSLSQSNFIDKLDSKRTATLGL